MVQAPCALARVLTACIEIAVVAIIVGGRYAERTLFSRTQLHSIQISELHPLYHTLQYSVYQCIDTSLPPKVSAVGSPANTCSPSLHTDQYILGSSIRDHWRCCNDLKRVKYKPSVDLCRQGADCSTRVSGDRGAQDTPVRTKITLAR